MEEFKKVAPDYEIGTRGTVRSLKHGKVKNLSLSPTKKGYLRVGLRIDGKQKSCQVHRLVALAFIPNLENKPEVNHINGIKSDNRVENLEWVTASENDRHARTTGLKISPQGEAHSQAKLTNEQVRFIRENPDGLTQDDLGKFFGVSQSVIGRIQLGETYKKAGGAVRQSNRVPDETRAEIRRQYEQGGVTQKELAKKFGIHYNTVRKIIREANR